MTLAILAALVRWPTASAAEPRAIDAHVIWWRGDLVCIACDDSAALAPGWRIRLTERERVVASGAVTERPAAGLMLVRLERGTLERVKKPARLRVWSEPPVASRTPRLRIGYPSPARERLAPGCTEFAADSSVLRGDYRVEAIAPDAYRFVRAASPGAAGADAAPARDPITTATQPDIDARPDTLLLRGFGESVDEEIALERGEIDVAVFWPGERSARLRRDPRWRNAIIGLRARGLIAAMLPKGEVSQEQAAALRRDPDLRALNTVWFGGDLMPWPRGSAADSAGAGETAARPTSRFVVDVSMPGREALESFLDHGLPAPASGIRIAWLDVPLAAGDSLAADWSARGIVPLYAAGCPLVCAPAHRDAVEAVGADALVGLFRCAVRGPRP